MGLFEYNADSRILDCPFALLCLLSQWSNDHTLAHFNFPSYNHWKMNTDIPNTGRFWQDWEEFLAQFRVLKSKLYASKPVKFSDLHMGAVLGGDTDVFIQEEPATGFICAPHTVKNNEGTIPPLYTCFFTILT
jgi:hypothetical protein